MYLGRKYDLIHNVESKDVCKTARFFFLSMKQLRLETEQNDTALKKKQLEEDAANASYGYGGKFGVQTDRMDQSAVGHDYIAKLEKHASQKDHSSGFGGKFGIQTDRIDKVSSLWSKYYFYFVFEV